MAATLLLALGLRLVGTRQVENGVYVDEAAIGYNAKSLLETGSDEYGQAGPLALRSFGDYKSPLLSYISIPLVSVFGEVVGVRLNSVTLGTMTVGIIYILAGPMAGLGMAILPWHVNLSGHGIEAVTATFLMAVWLVAVKNKKWRTAFVAVFLSIWAYHATKYLSPMLLLVTWWQMRHEGGHLSKGWTILMLVAASLTLLVMVQPFNNARALGVGKQESVVSLTRNVSAAYTSYFSPGSLISGDWQKRNNVYGVENMWWWQIILAYVGLIGLLKTGKWRKEIPLLSLWLLAPLPAAAAIDPFHAIRALIMTVPWMILVGIGWKKITDLPAGRQGLRLKILVIAVACFQTFILWERLTVQNPVYSYQEWIGGYSQLVDQTMKLRIKGIDQVIVDTTDEPAIYSLWQVLGKVDTNKKIPLWGNGYYQVTKWKGPESLVLGNGMEVIFKPVYWPEDQKKTNTVYVGSKKRFDADALKRAGAEVLFEVKDFQGNVVWMGVKTK